jgi:Fic family protein
MEAKFFELDAKMDAVRATMNRFPERVLKDYQGKLDVSWIFHDHALEGVVLSYSELKAAIDQRIISDVSLIPMYEEVKNHKVAVDFIRESVHAKKPPVVDIELVRKIYGILTPEAVAKGCPYRKENPLHRLYYHEIAPPEKIGYKMRKIADWLESSEFTNLHPIAQATRLQFKILSCYPLDPRTRGRWPAWWPTTSSSRPATCPPSSTRSSASATTRCCATKTMACSTW